MHPIDLSPDRMLRAEIAQRCDEGYDLGDLPERVEAAVAARTTESQVELFWAEIDALPLLPEPQQEPSSLEEIRAARPKGRQSFPIRLSGSDLYDRIYGAWLGRCAGCTLGKPVESRSRVQIEAYLRAANAYPLSSYFPVLNPFPEGLELRKNYSGTALGHVTRMVRDDDIDYTVLGLHILETCGRNFSSYDVASALLENLPFKKVYTAEVVAYRNLVNGMPPPQSACHRNPYREWIGAQIRADMWGYVNPGHPERAAEFAYRDASVTHTRNGIYGAMWAAACISAAFATNDPHEVIAVSLAEIPAECRLAAAVRATMTWAGQYNSWEETWERVNEQYSHYDPIHVINNTCLIVMGLLYGGGDLEKSICIAVMGGWDTDCTGATTGSIVGAMRGAMALPEKWIGPLNDRLESLIPGFNDSPISDLARRTVALVGGSSQ